MASAVMVYLREARGVPGKTEHLSIYHELLFAGGDYGLVWLSPLHL